MGWLGSVRIFPQFCGAKFWRNSWVAKKHLDKSDLIQTEILQLSRPCFCCYTYSSFLFRPLPSCCHALWSKAIWDAWWNSCIMSQCDFSALPNDHVLSLDMSLDLFIVVIYSTLYSVAVSFCFLSAILVLQILLASPIQWYKHQFIGTAPWRLCDPRDSSFPHVKQSNTTARPCLPCLLCLLMIIVRSHPVFSSIHVQHCNFNSSNALETQKSIRTHIVYQRHINFY